MTDYNFKYIFRSGGFTGKDEEVITIDTKTATLTKKVGDSQQTSDSLWEPGINRVKERIDKISKLTPLKFQPQSHSYYSELKIKVIEDTSVTNSIEHLWEGSKDKAPEPMKSLLGSLWSTLSEK